MLLVETFLIFKNPVNGISGNIAKIDANRIKHSASKTYTFFLKNEKSEIYYVKCSCKFAFQP